MHILYNRHHEDFLSKNTSKWVAATQGIGDVALRHPMHLQCRQFRWLSPFSYDTPTVHVESGQRDRSSQPNIRMAAGEGQRPTTHSGGCSVDWAVRCDLSQIPFQRGHHNKQANFGQKMWTPASTPIGSRCRGE